MSNKVESDSNCSDTIVSINEFNSNQEKYFAMALDELVFIKRGDYMYYMTCSNVDAVKEQIISEADDDLLNAIPEEEFRGRFIKIFDRVDKKYVSQRM